MFERVGQWNYRCRLIFVCIIRNPYFSCEFIRFRACTRWKGGRRWRWWVSLQEECPRFSIGRRWLATCFPFWTVLAFTFWSQAPILLRICCWTWKTCPDSWSCYFWFLSRSAWCGGYLWVEWAFDLDFILFLCLFFLFLLRLEKFQIFLGVLLVFFCDESAWAGRYSLGVFTLPSTTTKWPSIYDWEVLVPLIGAFNRLKPFLLNIVLGTSLERWGRAWWGFYS